MKITEQANKYTEDIDLMPIQQILQLMNMEDYSAVTEYKEHYLLSKKLLISLLNTFQKVVEYFT